MMFEGLKEKIEYEFNRFTNGKLCESRRSIFTASSEIEVKKMIRARLVQGYAMDTEAKLLEIPRSSGCGLSGADDPRSGTVYPCVC